MVLLIPAKTEQVNKEAEVVMINPEANRPGKRESRSDFSLDRERRRIRMLKLALALLGILLLVTLIVTLVMNQ